MVVAEWPRNRREIIRVSLAKFSNRDIVSLREFYPADTGEWRPGRSGIEMAVRHLPQLAAAFADALREARALGLISDDDDGAPK